MGYGDEIMGRAYPWQPYIIKSLCTKDREYFDPDFKVRPGHVYIKKSIRDQFLKLVSGDEVLINPYIRERPNGKGRASKENKDWGWKRWAELARLAKGEFNLAQAKFSGSRILPGVKAIPTETFHHMVALMSTVRGVVTVEGGVHHAAGALRMPAVVIFGAFNRPENFGYDFHANIWRDCPDGVGWRVPNPLCLEALRDITAEEVLRGMREQFR